MKYLLLLLLGSCTPSPEIDPHREEIESGLRWLRASVAYSAGCEEAIQTLKGAITEENKKQCFALGINYANLNAPMKR